LGVALSFCLIQHCVQKKGVALRAKTSDFGGRRLVATDAYQDQAQEMTVRILFALHKDAVFP
jgi:hypothetical protein